ncbi:MAG TPA: outer membrane beta-barrel protein [Elusimicrobiota bacterium]|nr:outer membrane beta-barrel protein [Elusimicrobiota bacterium]
MRPRPSLLLPVLIVLGLAAIASLSTIAAAQTAPAESDSDLRRQVQSLEKRLAELEKGMAPPATPAVPTAAQPFDFADFTWINGSSRERVNPLDTKYFTPELRLDANETYSFNHPRDHTLDGSCEVGRTNELQVQQLGVGGDLYYEHVRGRVMTQFGLYSQMTPRNDASTSRGQWSTGDAYKYISEANAGYHWDALHGVNLDAGIFMSYVGLFSYYNADNWAYQPSYVSANTPWFFNGLRLQLFPTDRWKAEFWLVNGWQSYNQFNEMPGLGTQQLWRPTGWLSVLSNDYWGYDTPNNPARQRWHTDNSLQIKYYDAPRRFVDKGAFSLTLDAGCEDAGGVSCFRSSPAKGPQQDFLGFMLYNRNWFARDRFALTLGGGAITNPGRYLVLLPPVNGATASTGSPYFTTNPGQKFDAWDFSITFDYMPDDWVTWRLEGNHRAANTPYFAGAGGMTPIGGNTGAPGTSVPGFTPDLRRSENRIALALLVKI